VVRQCVLAGVSRASVYARRHPEEADETDLLLCRLLDEEILTLGSTLNYRF